MRAMRTVSLGAMAAIMCVSVAFGAPDLTPRKESREAAGKSRSAGLSFKKPVFLTSAAPGRTAMSYLYSIEDGEEPSDHEWSGEPVIRVAPDGTVYIAGTCCIVASSPVWYSRDGKEFQELETPAHAREWTVGAEGDLAIDDDGGVFFVDTYITGLVLSRWSPGEGAPEWDYTVPANAGVPPGANDRPWIEWSSKGLHLYVNHLTHVAAYLSQDGGQTWSGGQPLGGTYSQRYFPGHLTADRETGTVWVVGLNSGKLASAVSEDGGASYDETTVIEVDRTKQGFSPIFTGATAVDSNGNGYTTFSLYSREDGTCSVYYSVSTDRGRSWGAPVKVSRGTGCATFPWIAAGADGKVALAWYQTPTASALPGSVPQDTVPETAEWSLHAAAVTDATGKRPKVSETQIRTETPVLTGPLRRELWDFLQLAIGPEGLIHITFAEKYDDSAPGTWYVRSSSGPRLR